MGMDLIGAGWTVGDHGLDQAAVKTALDAIPDSDLIHNIETLDYSGGMEWEPEEDDDGRLLDNEHNRTVATEIRDTLASGAEVAMDWGGRNVNSWQVPETSLHFVYMGGGSWGDDPFDGYTALCMFLDATTIWPALGDASGVVCGGLPLLATMQRYQRTNETFIDD